MEETKTTTSPAWIEEMRKWKEEDEERRAVLCIAADDTGVFDVLYGKHILFITALFVAMLRDPAYKNIITNALEIKENPDAANALLSGLKNFIKGGDIDTNEGENEVTDPEAKDLIITLLPKSEDEL